MPLPNNPGRPQGQNSANQSGNNRRPPQNSGLPTNAPRNRENANGGQQRPQNPAERERLIAEQQRRQRMIDDQKRINESVRNRPRPSEEYDYRTAQAQGRNALPQQPRTSTATSQQIRNQFDSDDDDTFEDLSIDEQLDYDEQEEEERRRREAKRRSADRRAQKSAENIRAQQTNALSNQFDDDSDDDIDLLFDDENNDDDSFSVNRSDDENKQQKQKPVRKPQALEPSESDGHEDAVDDDISSENSDEDESSEEEILTKNKAKKQKNKKKSLYDDNVKDDHGQDVFVDKEKGKLLPFGSKPSKKQRTKEYQYDDRKNMRTSANIIRFVIIASIIALLALGVKNTFFPEPPLTEDEVISVITDTVNITEFPLDRGEGFASDFAQAYLSTDPEGEATNSSVLSYFYTGEFSSETQPDSNRVVGSGYQQNVVYGPTVYESVALTDYSARYTIGAVVEPTAVAAEEGEEEVETVPQWVFLNVNVYYDSDTDKFTITPDSPSVLPNSPVGTSADLPDQDSLGEEVSDPAIADRVQPVLYGFLSGYRESTSDDHSTMDQYIISDPPATLTQGLGSNYTFLGGDVETATTYTIFSDPEDPNVLKVMADVTWVNGPDDSSSIQMTSTYVATLEQQDNGMYLVSRFQPLYFVQDEEAAAEEEAQVAEEEAEADAAAAPVTEEG